MVKDRDILEKIVYVNTRISKKLSDEINYAKDNLNKSENKKIKKKKYKYNFGEASHKLGKYLYSRRNNNK